MVGRGGFVCGEILKEHELTLGHLLLEKMKHCSLGTCEMKA